MTKSNEPRRKKTCPRGFPTRSDTNRAVQQKMALNLKFLISMVEDCTIYVAKTKALISCAGNRTADLRLCFRIYAKSRFSRDAAQMFQ